MSTSGRVPSWNKSLVLAAAISAIIATAGMLQAVAQETPSPITVKTDNESVNVVVSWNVQEIEPSQQVDFTLDFQHPFSGQSLPHVNYDFEITDEQGNVVESQTGLHTHIGRDIRTVSFAETGSFNMVLTIAGTGLDPPFDTTRSGTAQMPLSVVPEFQLLAPIALAVATAIGIAAARVRRRAGIA